MISFDYSNGFQGERSDWKKLLGTRIDSKHNFKDHLDGVIKKASRKINVFSRITPCMNIA